MGLFQMPRPDTYDTYAKNLNSILISQLNAASDDALRLAAADLRYARMLQEKRLQSKGVQRRVTYQPDDPVVSGVSWRMDSDARYVTRLPFLYVNTKRDFSVGENVKKSYNKKEILYSYMVWNRAQQPDAPYSCPNCGGATTIGNLTQGCKFCGTRFLADDLYPKAVNFYTLPAAQELLKRRKPFAVAGAVAMAAFGLLYNFKAIFAEPSQYGIFSMLGWLLYAALAAACGAFLGYVVGVFSIFFEVIVRAIASIPVIIQYGTAKRRLPNFMRRYSPDFSSDRFIGKVISMLNIIVYHEDLDNCALYGGKAIEGDYADIIDMSYNGTIDVRKCKEENGTLYIDLVMYMDVYTCKGGTIGRGNKKFRMTLCRSASAPEDHGFNIRAIQCHNCGGSFDATKEKHCPFCSTPYSIKDYDWVVTELSIK